MKILITGGVGFIGTNAALTFAKNGHDVTVVDDFSRSGVEYNANFLHSQDLAIKILQANVLATDDYIEALREADAVLHLAGQTAVTTSIKDPLHDFSNNLAAGITLLEQLRNENPRALCLYSSTNKVYGDLKNRSYNRDEDQKRYVDTTSSLGVSEEEPLSFVSPYGCSKGSLDQYFLDYARTYNVRTVVLRQSCIYGPFQQGVEDQGWVAHFCKQALLGKPITIFGDGYQVRDLLYVEDLINAYVDIIKNSDAVSGKVFNVGGGVSNAYSLLQVLSILEDKLGRAIQVEFDQERLGDQHYFVSDNSLLQATIDWSPTTDFVSGVEELIDWQRRYLEL